MKVVQMPVSPLSRAILIKEYGDEPIKFSYQSVAMMATYIRRPERENLNLITNTLTTHIEVVVTESVPVELKYNLHHTGLLLHRYHIERWMEWITALNSAGMPAMHALHNFMKYYEIEEDDYASDSAYRKWVRYTAKHRVKERTKTLLQSKMDYTTHQKYAALVPLPEGKLKNHLLSIINKNAHIFITNSEAKVDARLVESLKLFLLKEHGGFTTRELVAKTQLPSNTIYRKIRMIRDLIRTEYLTIPREVAI